MIAARVDRRVEAWFPRTTAVVIAVVAAAVSATSMVSGCDLRPGPEQLSSVAEAPQHFEAQRLKFTGSIRPDLVGIHSWHNSTSTTKGASGSGTGPEMFMFALPVVEEGWTPDDPVPLWLTATPDASRRGDPGPWAKEAAEALADGPVVGKVQDYAGREPGFRTTSGWQRAIEKAASEHGIVSDPHAPVVMWPDPTGSSAR